MPFYKIVNTKSEPPETLIFVTAEDEKKAVERYIENRMKLGLNSDTSNIKAVRGN